jgi:hypothetical protein
MVSQTRQWNQWLRLFSRRLNSKGGPQLDERQTQGRGQQKVRPGGSTKRKIM